MSLVSVSSDLKSKLRVIKIGFMDSWDKVQILSYLVNQGS